MTLCQRDGFPYFNFEIDGLSFAVYTQWFLVDIYCDTIAIASSKFSSHVIFDSKQPL